MLENALMPEYRHRGRKKLRRDVHIACGHQVQSIHLRYSLPRPRFFLSALNVPPLVSRRRFYEAR
jgi:hypothetical protein